MNKRSGLLARVLVAAVSGSLISGGCSFEQSPGGTAARRRRGGHLPADPRGSRATSGARHLDDQVDQAPYLTLVTNAAVLWTTTYLGNALDGPRCT